MTYGYCRISTKKQNIERQERNIKATYPEALIRKEVYTGTKSDRKEWSKLLKALKPFYGVFMYNPYKYIPEHKKLCRV